ncbi:MAG: DUF58 domain-containing protein [Clostridiales Family XIII bacterium]|jgi:uncharacterized protein (DUF58 family)|nr:DUF58 domain-containing protein [Clostridiales Family XIII bacterium]
MRSERKKKSIRWVVCAAALCVLAAPAVFMNDLYGYLPILAAGVSILCSFAYLTALRKRLTYEEVSDLSNCRRETEVDFVVRLRNGTPLVCPKLEPYFYISDIFGGDDAVTSEVITLAPREERTFDFAVRFDHIGTYSAGVRKIVVHDLIGLFSYTIENPTRHKVSVSPKLFDVEKLHISNTSLSESERMIVPITSDGADYTGVREYVWGDPIKTIHWKLSARGESYLTKQFESYGTVGVTVILDFFSPEYDTDTLMSVFDAVVESGLSVGNYARENGMEYEIVYTNKQGEKKKFSKAPGENFADIIEDIPRISTSSGSDNGVKLLREEGNARYSHGNIVYCTANPTEEAANVLAELKQRKKHPALIAVVPKKLEGGERRHRLRPLRTLEYENIPYYILSHARELGGGEKG